MKKTFSVTSVFILLAIGALVTSCGGTSTGNPDSEDISVTGSAVGAVGGALSGSGPNGTQAFMKRPQPKSNFLEAIASAHFIPQAIASGFCPSFKTAQGSGCSAIGGNLYLSYNDCFFLGSVASWQGVLEMHLSTAAASCGVFPASVANASLYRQFVASSGSTSPGAAQISALGFSVNIDDATNNLGNFDSATITPLINAGYGSRVDYNGAGFRNGITLGHHEYLTGVFDHSIAGSLTITPTSLSTRTITGSVSVYHNLLKVIGTVQFNSAVHSDSCCWPISGTITTTYSAGSVAPTAAGASAVGKQEIMTITSCGTASLQSYDGTTKNIVLSRCY